MTGDAAAPVRPDSTPTPDYRALFASAPNPYVLLDPALRIVDMNDAYLAATMSRREAIVGKGIFDAFPDGEPDAGGRGSEIVRQSLLKVVEDGRPDHLPVVAYSIRTASGAFERRMWSATHVPILDERGRTAFVLQNTVDITDVIRRQADTAGDHQTAGEILGRARAVQAVNRSLWAERAQLRRLFEQAPGFMAVLRGPDLVFELANAAFMRLVGRDDLAGRPVRHALPEVEGQGFIELLADVSRTGEPFVGRGMPILLQPSAEGPPEERFVDFVYQPVMGRSGAVDGIFVQGHDITEQKKAEAALRELASTLEARIGERTAALEHAHGALRAVNANLEAIVAARVADLKAANEEIQRFAYIVSHDLRSPLVNVMGFTSELEDARSVVAQWLETIETAVPPAVSAAVGEDIPEAIAFIRASTGRMDRLINAILRLSREGRRTLAPETIRLRELVASLAESLAPRADATGASVTVGDLPDVVSDRLALEQVFANLLDNALKYLRPDVPGRIHVRGWEDGPNIRVAVVDNGRGVEARDFERIFDLFRRAGAQDVPGEGIGLAHVRALVRRLGGVVSLSSEPGEGTTFIVTLPRVLAAPDVGEAA
ncbi:ATP-binding protein [Alsobacter sp. R-9]